MPRPEEIEMLSYQTTVALQQEKLGRYQAEAERAARRRNDPDRFDLSLAVSRALGSFARRGVVRPAV